MNVYFCISNFKINYYEKKINIAVIVIMGISLVANAQNEINSYLQINADNSSGHVASRIFLKSHDDYRGAGIFTLGQTNNWFIGNPYTDQANSFMIGVSNKSDGTNSIAQKKFAKFYINKNGNVGIGTTVPAETLTLSKPGVTLGIYDTNPLSKANNRIGRYSNSLVIQTNFTGGWKDNINFLDNGNVGIGTRETGIHKFAVEGSIGAREIKVQATGWSDFVFEKEYDLPTLEEVESQIKEKGHLKDIPSAREVEKNGVFLGEMDAKLLQKIEELTLYAIEQEKSLKTQNSKIDEQQKKIERLETLVYKLLKDKN